MAQALFISRNDIVSATALGGNVDTDKFLQFAKIAQDTHILNYLGTELYTKISTDIENQTIAGNYLLLVNTYIKPMLVHWSMVEYLPWSAYTIANKGVFKHGSENSESVSKEDVDFLTEKARSIAQNYTDRYLEYMCKNYTLFPEYTTNESGDVFPDKNNDFNGWYF